jgi:hypothetical protein
MKRRITMLVDTDQCQKTWLEENTPLTSKTSMAALLLGEHVDDDLALLEAAGVKILSDEELSDDR